MVRKQNSKPSDPSYVSTLFSSSSYYLETHREKSRSCSPLQTSEQVTPLFTSVFSKQALFQLTFNICEFEVPLVPNKCHFYPFDHIFIIKLPKMHFTVIYNSKSCLTGNQAMFIIGLFQVTPSKNCYKLLQLYYF